MGNLEDMSHYVGGRQETDQRSFVVNDAEIYPWS